MPLTQRPVGHELIEAIRPSAGQSSRSTLPGGSSHVFSTLPFHRATNPFTPALLYRFWSCIRLHRPSPWAAAAAPSLCLPTSHSLWHTHSAVFFSLSSRCEWATIKERLLVTVILKRQTNGLQSKLVTLNAGHRHSWFTRQPPSSLLIALPPKHASVNRVLNNAVLSFVWISINATWLFIVCS